MILLDLYFSRSNFRAIVAKSKLIAGMKTWILAPTKIGIDLNRFTIFCVPAEDF